MLGVGEPGLSCLYLCVCLADETVGCKIGFAVGMKLISHRATSAASVGECRLVAKRVGMLEAAEFSPRLVEFSRHAEKFLVKRARICR